MVYRRCLTLLRNEEKALEAMQDVFLKVLDNNKLDSKAASSLFYTIATNYCLNIIKKDALINSKNVFENDSVNSEEENNISKDMIFKLFKDEKPKVFNIAVLYFLDGMTLDELSRETKMSVSGLRKTLAKVKTKAEKFKKENL